MHKTKSEKEKLPRKLSGLYTKRRSGPRKKHTSKTGFERKRKFRKADRVPKAADLAIPKVSKCRPKFSCAKEKPTLLTMCHNTVSEKEKLPRKLSGSSTESKSGLRKKQSSKTKVEKRRKVRIADRVPKAADLTIPKVSKCRPKFSCAKEKPTLLTMCHTTDSTEREGFKNAILVQQIKSAVEQVLKEQTKDIAEVMLVLMDKKIGAELKMISEEQKSIKTICKNVREGMAYYGSESNYYFVKLLDKMERLRDLFIENSLQKDAKKCVTNGRVIDSGRSWKGGAKSFCEAASNKSLVNHRSQLTSEKGLQSKSRHTNKGTKTFTYSSVRKCTEKETPLIRNVMKKRRKGGLRREKSKCITIQSDSSCDTVLLTLESPSPSEDSERSFEREY